MIPLKYTLFILYLTASLVLAQSTISGRVFDSQTNEPLPYANVFLSKTTIGSSSDLDGYFRVENIPDGIYELIVQYIGYELFITQITTLEKKSFQLEVGLKPKPFQGKEVVIEAKRDKFWKDCLEKFREQFLGWTENARESKILNPLSINFSKEENKDTYIATCDSCIVVENRSLGYKIDVVLYFFKWDKQRCFHQTYSKFSELEPQDEEEYQKWLTNREKSYKGSFKHFFSSLATNHKDRSDYKILILRDLIASHQDLYYPISTDFLYEFISDSMGFKKIVLEDYLRVNYDGGSKRIEAGLLLKGRNKFLLFDKYGTIMNPIHFERYGYWGYLRFADLLPEDYHPNETSN
jgi:hypothetical protein